ncbi:MAG TPA: type II toxin-antitoxin system Phd/YefM family antitoxin [Stellaceae bacterium]|nr:type II toxin-antitoxin system Phd/YefM family antitoxin [Stellaceae bacterium]
MDTWKLQDAKARFSEVVERAMVDGPQVVTRHGTNAVVVISYKQFTESVPAEDFKTFLLSSHSAFELTMTRDKHFPRKNYFEVPA